jgi:hypothetical protein
MSFHQQPVYGSPDGRLAEHETIELHELLSFKNVTVAKQKAAVGYIECPQLKQLYLQSIQMNEQQIVELTQLLQNRPLIR